MFSSSKSGTTAMMRRGSVLMPMNFITPSVHCSLRFSAFCPGYSMLRQALADDHHSLRTILVAVVEVTSLAIGTPSVAKNPGDTDRKFAR